MRLNWPSGFLNYSLYSDLPPARTPHHANCADDHVIVCRRVYFSLTFVFFCSQSQSGSIGVSIDIGEEKNGMHIRKKCHVLKVREGGQAAHDGTFSLVTLNLSINVS